MAGAGWTGTSWGAASPVPRWCSAPPGPWPGAPGSGPAWPRTRAVFRRNLPGLAQIFLATLALQVVGLAFPVANQLLLDRVVVPRQAPWLWGLALGLGSAVIASSVLGLVRSWVVLGLQLELNFALMGRFLGHLLRLPLGFFLQRDPGDLVQRAQSNAELQDLLGTRAVNALLDGFLLLGFAALMIAYHPRLAGLVIAISLMDVAMMAVLVGPEPPAAGRGAGGRGARRRGPARGAVRAGGHQGQRGGRADGAPLGPPDDRAGQQWPGTPAAGPGSQACSWVCSRA